ncbi:MAG: hypothetical protein KDB58_12605 [Solirubrobacterales bacterium]|nr:hypothetical protein [Solirubrobacterales bacterium]MCO5327639.1 hypothetical protein [Solirubrobacterales bacterium]
MDDSQPEDDQRDSRWVPPADNDLIGFPLFIGVAVAVAAIFAAFLLIGPLVGVIVLIAVLVLALAISYRVVTASDPGD